MGITQLMILDVVLLDELQEKKQHKKQNVFFIQGPLPKIIQPKQQELEVPVNPVKFNSNRDTPELRICWAIPANPGVQTNFYC